jgi:hypothetical protein
MQKLDILDLKESFKVDLKDQNINPMNPYGEPSSSNQGSQSQSTTNPQGSETTSEFRM